MAPLRKPLWGKILHNFLHTYYHTTPITLHNGHSHGNENHQTPPPIDLAIIGGGIGGLALLLGILHHTSPSIIRVHLYESAPAFSEIGAGVGFGPNSVRAMRIVSPRLQEAYARIAAKPNIEKIKGKEKVLWHRLVMGMDGRGGSNTLKAGDEIAVVYNENRWKSAHRATFLEEMIKLLPGGTGEGYVTFKKRCVDIDDLGEGRGVRIHFADGTTTEASAVIGCDGVKSRVRQILLKGQDNVEPRFTGKYAYRGLIPMDEAVAAMGPRAKGSQMTWGYGGHLVCFPVDQGSTLNVVAFHSKDDGKWEQEDWVVPGTVAQCLEDYKDWSQPVLNLLSKLKKPDIWAIFEHPPASTYYSGSKICGLGDAMHASSPHNGAGAGMCIEDAAVMSTLLAELSSPDPTALEKVFRAFDSIRRPRTQKLVVHSRDAGMLYDFEKDGILDDPEKLKKEIEQRLLWIWDVDLDEHCREAIEIMKN